MRGDRRQLGGAFGIAILVAVFAGSGGYVSAQAFSDGFAPAIAVASGLSLAGAIAGVLSPRRRAATEAAQRRSLPALGPEGAT